jgi:hypothetical protein
LQVVQAARFLERAKSESGLEPDPSWDPSVVALLNYPEVLAQLDEDLDWTWRLGNAVIQQQSDVLAAVEYFRERAHVAGNLVSDDRQVVDTSGETLIIRPASPERIYVPYYAPAQVTVYQTTPVVHYYPRPYPVYYYPYPDDYDYDWPYFWGVRSAYVMGWSSHHVNVYHHYHPRHPYSGCHYGRRWYHDGYRPPHHHGGGWAYPGGHWKGRDHGGGDRNGGHGGDDDWNGGHAAPPPGGHRGGDRGWQPDDGRWQHDGRRGGARPPPGERRAPDATAPQTLRAGLDPTTAAPGRRHLARSERREWRTARQTAAASSGAYPSSHVPSAQGASAPAARQRAQQQRAQGQQRARYEHRQAARAGASAPPTALGFAPTQTSAAVRIAPTTPQWRTQSARTPETRDVRRAERREIRAAQAPMPRMVQAAPPPRPAVSQRQLRAERHAAQPPRAQAPRQMQREQHAPREQRAARDSGEGRGRGGGGRNRDGATAAFD